MLNQIEQNGEYGMADEAVAPKRVQPRLASAIMLLRDRDAGQGIEVFMVRRVILRDFFPDAYAFPGGPCFAPDKTAAQDEEEFLPPPPPGPLHPQLLPPPPPARTRP